MPFVAWTDIWMDVKTDIGDYRVTLLLKKGLKVKYGDICRIKSKEGRRHIGVESSNEEYIGFQKLGGY